MIKPHHIVKLLYNVMIKTHHARTAFQDIKCCDGNASGHHHYNKMQLSDGNSTCQVVNKIIRLPNRTNRPNPQASKGSLSLMRCNFRMENTICQIEHNIFHPSNRTNRNFICRVVNKIFPFAE